MNPKSHAPMSRRAAETQSTYSELTDSPKAMRRIVSASSSATDSWRILLQPCACGRIRQLSVAELLAETIRRIAFGESVSSLYVD